MQVDYTASRNIKSGHTIGLPYTIDFELSKEDYTPKAVGSEVVSLNGNTVNLLDRFEESWALTSALILDTSTPDNADLLEFLSSVVNGEPFETDLRGTLEFYRLSKGFRRRRTGTTNVFTYSFSVILAE